MDREAIESAAILHLGKVRTVPRPGRHHDIIRMIAEENPGGPPVRGGLAQGFVTTTGRYVTRKLAAGIALAAGQTTELKWGPHLYSEDLW